VIDAIALHGRLGGNNYTRTCNSGLVAAKAIEFHGMKQKVLVFCQSLDHVIAAGVNDAAIPGA
jgi:hypothetical protein